ncbi:solute carrier family 22 member 18 isoform X3 [Ornithorhynchus anatinus]|uniref:solute carrier family 22 member 18 isoform X3 n=1 Tax=Ornithorhynchus anatinus TaxID=9258 RepID=UPI0010A7E6AC|nr:solute carrier family 22 member 18 isoform X3 [Ornithorhynchus anatinus]
MAGLSRWSVIRVTYLLTVIQMTCLFMQFSVLLYVANELGLDSVGFGLLQTTFGLLQLLGSPVFGRIYSPIYVALGASTLGAAISASCIPANTKMDAQGRSTPGGGGGGGVFSLKETWRLLTLPRVLPVFTIKVLSGFPAGIFLIMLSVISVNVFGLEAQQTGYLMSYFGVFQMVIQGLVIGRLTSRYSESALLRLSVLVLGVVGLAMALMTTIVHFCLLVPPLLFGLVSLNILTDNILTKAVSPMDTGAMLGLCACVQPLTRTVGPTLGGFLYQTFGVSSLGYLQFGVNLALTLYLRDGSVLRGVEKPQ